MSERDTIRGVPILAGAVYIYIWVWRSMCRNSGTYHNSSACHAYVMWAELGHSQFLYVPTRFKRSNHETARARALKMFSNGTMRFGLYLVFSLLFTALLL